MLDSLSLINPVNLEKIFKIPGLCKKAGFSDNDKYVAILMDNKQKKNFSLLDARDYKFDTILFLESVLDFCFTSSYKQIYLSFSGGGLKVYDVEKKSMQTLYEGNVLSPLMIYADTAGEIFVASSPNKLVSWTLQNGSFHQFRNVPEGIVFKDVSFGGTRSGCLVKDKTDRSIWYMDLSSPDTSENKLFRFPKTLKYPVTFSLLKNQNRWMLCDNFCVKFISFDGLRTDSIVPDSGYRLIDYSLSGDGRYIAFLAIDSTVKLNYFSRLSNYKCQIIVVDSRSHRVFSKIDPQGRVDDISFAVGPANIWLAFHNGFLEQYSVDGKLLTRNLPIPEYRTLLQDENAPGIFHPNSLKFIKTESARLVYLRTTNEIVLVDALEEKVVKRLKMPLNFKDPVVLNNEKWVLFPSDGGGIKIIDIASTKEICTLYYLDSTDYVVLAPNGIFDATPGAMKKMSFLAGMESVDLSQLKYRYYQPGLLPILLGYKDEGLREVPAFDFIRLFPKMELAVKDSKLSISLRNRGGGIGKVSVSISNIQIIDDARLSADDSSRSEISLSVDLAQYSKFFRYDTTNVIRVLAWNAEGYLSSRPDTVHYAPPSSGKGMKYVARDKNGNRIIPHLYALIVGTSDYAGQQIDLQYPAKDAEAFSSALAVGAERLFGKDHVQVKLLASGTKEEPTIDNIRKEMETMTQASPDDIVVLYFSGHGINYGGQDGMFYYLTMGAEGLDAVYLNDPVFRSTKAISSQEIANSLNKIPAQKKVLILDACSSGRAADNLLASLTKDIPSSQKRALEFTQDATGAYLLASSAANTVSYESPIYEHGLLTYTLLQGMHGGQLTKIESDEYVDVEKLFMYAKNEVPKLAFDINGVQDPVMRTPGAKGSLYIGKLTEEDKMRIVLPEPKAVFLPCVFTNASEDLAAEELDIGERLNERLDQLSAKGKDSRISFTRAAAYPDAWIIKGKYLLKGSEITVTYILKKGSRIMLPQQTETVPLTKLDSLLDNIISNVKKTSAVK
jgi:hypothetical protein